VSRVYRDVNAKRPDPDYYGFKLEWKHQDNYSVTRKIGRGKYSDVFEGERAEADGSSTQVVIKVLKPVKKKKIRREIKILRELHSKSNDDEKGLKKKSHPGTKYIIKLLECIEDSASRTKCLVFEYVDACDFKTLFPKLQDLDVRYYMYKLLLALDYCHSKGIMHRDVKPHNVMINHRKGELKLIDWGLAEFYYPGKEYNVRVASRYFKGPELLVNMRTYDYSLDIWSFGCMLAGMVFKRHPFFHGKSNEDQLVRILKVLGSAGLFAYLTKFNIRLPSAYDAMQDEFSKDNPYKQKEFKEYITKGNEDLATDEALELLQMCLRFDHSTRPSASEASKQKYFDSVRTLKAPAESRATNCQNHPEGHHMILQKESEV